MPPRPQLRPAVDPARDRLRGGGDGAVDLVEYGDYECPYSRLAYRAIQALEGELGHRLRFVFRHFPLTAIHPHALAAAAAAESAAAQGRFWAMHDALFHRQKALEGRDLVRYAQEIGLDLERFRADFQSDAVADRIAEDLRSGVDSGVNGTPTLYIRGARHEGSYEHDALRAALTASAVS